MSDEERQFKKPIVPDPHGKFFDAHRKEFDKSFDETHELPHAPSWLWQLDVYELDTQEMPEVHTLRRHTSWRQRLKRWFLTGK